MGLSILITDKNFMETLRHIFTDTKLFVEARLCYFGVVEGPDGSPKIFPSLDKKEKSKEGSEVDERSESEKRLEKLNETIQSLDPYNDLDGQNENIHILESAINLSVDQILEDLQKNGKDSPFVRQKTKEIHKILQKVDKRDRAIGTRLFQSINDQLSSSDYRMITDPKFGYLQIEERP